MSALVVTAAPAPAGRELTGMIAALGNALEGSGTRRPASDTQLVCLHGRLAIVAAALVPGPLARIRQAVAFLLGNWYPGRALAERRAMLILDNYAMVLEPLPAWSVEGSCLKLARGEVADVNPDFPPAAARVYATARDLVTPYRAEQDVVLRIIRATHYERGRWRVT